MVDRGAEYVRCRHFGLVFMYDDDALAAAEALTRNWTGQMVGQLREDVPKLGLKAEIDGRPLIEVAREVVGLSRGGLTNRAITDSEGFDETVFLAPLEDTLAFGTTPAERMLEKYEKSWNRDINQIFSDYAF